jgi:uncharacterized protein YecT (DUF1311 family)
MKNAFQAIPAMPWHDISDGNFKKSKMVLSFFFYTLLLVSNNALAASAAQVDYDALYSNCLKDNGPINNGTVEACSSNTSDAAKKEMNTLYKKIYRRFFADFPEDAKQFEQTQRAWLTYRNGQCTLAGAHVGSPMYAFCPMTLNIARVKELRELAGE